LAELSEFFSRCPQFNDATMAVRKFEIPWLQIAGLRNRIVHDYAGIDLKLAWNILQTAIQKFAHQIAELK
jgi:uncharacterized protein with HEPN domain